MIDPIEFDWESAIRRRASESALVLDEDRVAALAHHARSVLRANDRLHLTTIVIPEEFVERHLGEAFEGAALLPMDVVGTLADIGSGNGYPVLPLAAARPGLAPVLIEASKKKASFLAAVLGEFDPARGRVIERQVQRAPDLDDVGGIRVITARGVGGWFRLCPKLAPALDPEGVLLLWAGQDVATVRKREAWRRLELLEVRTLPGADRTAIWKFGAAKR